MKCACVIGWPIAHSRSPLIHGHWLKLYGVDGAYTREPVPAEALTEFLKSLASRGLAGCNVTVPHKEAAYQLADVRDASAVAVHAANTLWVEDGKLACANTDAYGFMANLDRAAPQWRESDGAIVILGAGGSARAVAYGFLQAGRRDVRVVNRSVERAHDMARHFGSFVTAHPWSDRNDLISGAAAIVNTTTLGMNGVGDPAIAFDRAPARCVVADLVYVPLETAFLQAAKARGLKTIGGLGMLLHQAAPGFEKWFGIRPEVTPELFDLVARDIEGRRC
ncbi:MAG: shikimate dehydrogenase [Hyphomicrobium sp.]